MARPPVSERTQVFRSAGLIGALTLLSRILGMARDVLSASLFGAGMVWDGFIIAWTVPNLFRRLFGEGALSSTFIPVYSEALEEGPPERPARVLNATLGTLGALLAFLVVAGAAAALALPRVVEALFGGAPGPKLVLTTNLTALLLPYLPLICVTALFAAVLNVHRRFAASALGPALLNVFWIAGLGAAAWVLPGRPEDQILLVGGALLAGGAAQLLILLPQLSAFVGVPRPRIGVRDPDVRRIGTMALPVIAGLAMLQINVLVDRLVAELCVQGDGAVSALYYGNRLVQFPLAIIGIAVSTAAFPVFARLAARGDLQRLRRALGGALRGTLFLALPAATGLVLLAPPIVGLLFAHGEFGRDLDSTARTARVLAFYAVGLPAYILLPAAARAFYALKDTKTPTRAAMVALGANVVLNLTLVWVLDEGGLALATSASAFLNLGILLVRVRGTVGTRLGADLFLPAWKAALSTAVMAAVVLAAWSWMPILTGAGFSARFARLSVAVGGGAAVFFGVSVLLRDANLAVLRRRGAPAGMETPEDPSAADPEEVHPDDEAGEGGACPSGRS